MVASTAVKLWRWYADIFGALFIAVTIAFAIVYAYGREGPVVQVLNGPLPKDVISVPYMGMLTYEIVTLRHESCPGTVVRRFKRMGTDPIVILFPNEILASEIRVGRSDAIVGIQLPPAIYPGDWEFSTSVTHRCPLRNVTEITSRFLVRVEEESK